jgi:hypothetical protein
MTGKVLRRISPLVVIVAGVLPCGCSFAMCEIRMQAKIEEVRERVLSVALSSKSGLDQERVFSYGVFTAAEIEGTDDTAQDFSLGLVTPSEIQRGTLRVWVREAGGEWSLPVPPRKDNPCCGSLVLRLPRDVEQAEVTWVERSLR